MSPIPVSDHEGDSRLEVGGPVLDRVGRAGPRGPVPVRAAPIPASPSSKRLRLRP